jgi:hypothetical protein
MASSHDREQDARHTGTTVVLCAYCPAAPLLPDVRRFGFRSSKQKRNPVNGANVPEVPFFSLDFTRSLC